MKCLTPFTINGEIVPCGNCYACQTNRRNQWDLRLRVEHMHSAQSFFVTLTYADEFLPFENIVSKDDHLHFINTLRNKSRSYEVKWRYYVIGEYGERYGRPHLHYLLFSDVPDIDVIRLVRESWPYGFSDVGDVTHKSIHYVTKWHINPKFRVGESVERHGFSLMSKGIGKQLLSTLTVDNISPTYSLDGKRFPLSRYYRKKLGYQVTDVMDMIHYIGKKLGTDNLLQINAQIKRLQKVYKEKQLTPRKSLF